MKTLQLRVGELGRAAADAQLIQPGTLSHQNRKGARRDLRIKGSAVARFDAVERLGAVGDEARKDIESAGRTLRIGNARNTKAEFKTFEQRDDIDTACLQHRAFAQ